MFASAFDRVTGWLPSFRMKSFFIVVEPGESCPQVIDDSGVVQLDSWYTPIFVEIVWVGVGVGAVVGAGAGAGAAGGV